MRDTATSLQPQVSLVFPPLVETNFGNYYPSTAVLAAYLTEQDIAVSQKDLNEDFALYLLEPERLEKFCNGEFPFPANKDSIVHGAIVAKLLKRNPNLIFDQHGRHDFRNKNSGDLIGRLGTLFSTDLQIPHLTNLNFTQRPEVKFYEKFFEDSGYLEELPESIRLIGISVPMGGQLLPSLTLANLIKRKHSDITVVMGGPTFSLLSELDIAEVLKAFSSIDCVVRYDGEIPLYTLAQQAIAGKLQPELVPGLSFLVGNEAFHNPPGLGLRLEEIPFAMYDREIMSRLAAPEIGVIQARGCYWGKCAYCDFVELYGVNPPYRTRSVNRFVDEIEFQINQHGNYEITAITESIPAAFARKLSTELQKRKLDVRWNSFAMVDSRFTEKVFEELAAGGCSFLVIGMETMVDRVLKLVKKSATFEDNVHFIKTAAKTGIQLAINIIPDLPTTTYEESINALNEFRNYRDFIYSAYVFPFEATRSSAIGRSPAQFGLEPINLDEGKGQAQFSANHLDWSDPAMSPDQRKQVIAEYRSFADEVNSTRKQDLNLETVTHLMNASGFRARIDTEHLDWFEFSEILHIYNWSTRKSLQLSLDWGELLNSLRDSLSFQLEDVNQIVGDEMKSQLIIKKLLQHRIAVVL